MSVARQGLGEDVGGHGCSIDVLEMDAPFVDYVIANEVVAEVNVFGVRVMLRILRQANAAFAVGV